MTKIERKESFRLAESLRMEQEKIEKRVLNNLWADLDRITEGILHSANRGWVEGWIIFEQRQNLGLKSRYFQRLYCTGGAFNFMVVVEERDSVWYELVDVGDFEFNDLLWIWESLLNENTTITTEEPTDPDLKRMIKEFKEDQNVNEQDVA